MIDDFDYGTKLIAEHLRKLYWEQNLSMRGIAKELNVSAGTISNWFRHFKIPIKPPTADGRYRNVKGSGHGNGRGPRDEFSHVSTHIRTAFRPSRMGLARVCARCGRTQNLVVHHRDHNHFNNVPANLEVLCRICHAKEHDMVRFLKHHHRKQD